MATDSHFFTARPETSFGMCYLPFIIALDLRILFFDLERNNRLCSHLLSTDPSNEKNIYIILYFAHYNLLPPPPALAPPCFRCYITITLFIKGIMLFSPEALRSLKAACDLASMNANNVYDIRWKRPCLLRIFYAVLAVVHVSTSLV